MASVKEHYDNHLAHFYEWMVGDFDSVRTKREEFYKRIGLSTHHHTIAVDLGSGHGIDSIALLNLGYRVVAVDFTSHLLEQLRLRDTEKKIAVVHADLLQFCEFVSEPSLIICTGDTLAHLQSLDDVNLLLRNCFEALSQGGKLLLSFRDYGRELIGTQRFIPVKADDARILTCMLEYNDAFVQVSDILWEKVDGKWKQSVSQYTKLRLTVSKVQGLLQAQGFNMVHREDAMGFTHLLAEKP